MKRLWIVVAALGWALLVTATVGVGTSASRSAPSSSDPVFTYSYYVRLDSDANNREIAVTARDGSGSTILIAGDTDDYGAAWSPTGDRIAFVRRDACDTGVMSCASLPDNIWLARQDGTDTRPLTFFPPVGNTEARSLSWSPDGSRIAHCRGGPRNSSVWISRVDRRAATRVSSMECVEVAWSPDGRTLAIVGGIGHIVLFTPNGRRIRVLTRPRNGGRIVWSPDSKRLAISTDKGLYAVPVNGSGPRPLLSARKLAVLHWGAEMILFDKRAVHSRNPNSTRITKLFALPTPLQDLAWRRVP